MAKIASKFVRDNSVQFKFANGHILTCEIGKVDSTVIDRLALHGLSQKIGDSYSGAESVEEAIANATQTWNQLLQGLWAVRAQTGGKYVEALIRVTGGSFDDCLAKWNGMTDEQKKALRKHPRIKKAIAQIDLERAQAQVESTPDTDGDDLGGLFD